MAHKFGAVALVGRPNVGKSTLLNTFVGQKVAIVSDKAQTTRTRVLGVLTEPDYQIAFVDTPGWHEPHTQLGKIMNEAMQASLSDVDLVLVVVDGSKKPNDDDEAIAGLLKRGWRNPYPREGENGLLLCMNKMDLLKAHDVVEHSEMYKKLFGTEQLMLTSLTKKQNIDLLLEMIVERLPEGESVYPEDEVTDQPMRFIAAELVREKALRLTRQEVPHALAAVVDLWEETPERTEITVSLVVEKEGQKAIMIGKGGSMLKQIGTEARLEIQEMIGRKVYLEIIVKVRNEWRQNPRMLRDLEYLG